jgi:hypothetical protein
LCLANTDKAVMTDVGDGPTQQAGNETRQAPDHVASGQSEGSATEEAEQAMRHLLQRVKDNRNAAAMAFVGILVALAFQGFVKRQTGNKARQAPDHVAPGQTEGSAADEAEQAMRHWLQRVKDNRDTSAMAFVGILVALAFLGVVSPALQYINGTISVRVVAQFAIFIILGLWTFLLGSYTLTLSPFTGWAWFVNFFVLTLSSFTLIFMASATVGPVEVSTRIDFIGYYLIYFVIETVWALGTLIWALRKNIFRPQLPFAVLSIIPFIAVLVIKLMDLAQSGLALIILLIITIAAFISTIGLLAQRSLL